MCFSVRLNDKRINTASPPLTPFVSIHEYVERYFSTSRQPVPQRTKTAHYFTND
jgi:hypothetical protein